jgi:hypothetical protein
MNPTLPADYLQRMRDDDPEAYRSEVLGEFRAGLSTLLDADALQACVADRRDLPPADGITYHAFADCSGGRSDAAALAIAHADGQRVVVDLVRSWAAPHDPSAVIAEAATIARSYRCHTVTADRYAGEFQRTSWQRAGLTFCLSDDDRSQLALSASVEIPNDPALLRELRGLERRRGFAGKDRVDHRPGAHDDRANALAGAVHVARRAAAYCPIVAPLGIASASPFIGRFGVSTRRLTFDDRG